MTAPRAPIIIIMKTGEIEHLLLHDDLRLLVPVVRRHDLNRRRFEQYRDAAQAPAPWPYRLLGGWARRRFRTLCTQLDVVHVLLKSRAEHLSLDSGSSSTWRRAVDDLLHVTEALSFYDSDVRRRVSSRLDPILDELVARRVADLIRDLFANWDADGYLSAFAVDWALDAQRFLDVYPGAVAGLSRPELERVAREFVAVIGRRVAPRPPAADDDDAPCAICAAPLASSTTSCCQCQHGDVGCGQVYHRACTQAWVSECKSRSRLPSCPSCMGVWVTRRLPPGSF